MITQFNNKNLVDNLPDAYSKHPASNNAKILAIEKTAMDDLRASLSAALDSLDLDKAYGKTLDMYGAMLGQMRGIATDEQYRVLLKNKVARSFANADINSIVRAICKTFGCDPSEVVLTELDEPCKVRVEGLPIVKINESNIDINTAIAIVASLIPAGVYLDTIEFSGTFEFAEGNDVVYDEAAGFADDDLTIGGYLGLTSSGVNGGLPV